MSLCLCCTDKKYVMTIMLTLGTVRPYNNNNNNNPICKAPECQKTSVALNTSDFMTLTDVTLYKDVNAS